MSWPEWVSTQNDATRAEGRWRGIRDLDLKGPSGSLGTDSVVSFASNDYLGLTAHPKVIEGARLALDRWGAGSGSARLIAGSRPVHSQLELALARWKGTEAALLFPNGFAANTGVLTALGRDDVTIFSDERNHASIIDGCRMASASVEIFGHLDYDALDQGLARAGRSIVVTDTVFSMDGDVANVSQLAQLCHSHGALLVVDEAHAVLGPRYRSRRSECRARGHSEQVPRGHGWIRCRRPRAHRSVDQPGPPFHLHDRVLAGRCWSRARSRQPLSFGRRREAQEPATNSRRAHRTRAPVPHRPVRHWR